MRLAELWRRHLTRLEMRGPQLRKRYEPHLRQFLSFQQARTRHYREIDEDLLQQFSDLPSYRADTAIALRHWLRFLYHQGFLELAWHEEVPRPAFRLARLRQVPSHAQVLSFLNHLGKEPEALLVRALVELAYGSGLRTGEIMALELADLRWAEESVVVRKTKNGYERTVPLTTWSQHTLQGYLSQARPLWREEHSGNALWLYPSSGWPMQPFWIHRFLRGHQAGFTMHALRHACATRLLEGGASVREVQELLGHRCLRSTQIYTHLKTLQLQEMHRRYHPRGASPLSS